MKKLFILVTILFILAFICSRTYKMVQTNHVSFALDGIRVESSASYPQTDNPVMEGVTIKEYTARRIK